LHTVDDGWRRGFFGEEPCKYTPGKQFALREIEKRKGEENRGYWRPILGGKARDLQGEKKPENMLQGTGLS